MCTYLFITIYVWLRYLFVCGISIFIRSYWLLIELDIFANLLHMIEYACLIYLFICTIVSFIFLHLYYWVIVCISYDILTYLILHVFIILCDMIDCIIACLNIHILHWLLIVACCTIFTFAISIFDVWHYVFTLVYASKFSV